MNQKNCIHKIYLQENTSNDVLFNVAEDIRAYGFPKWTSSKMFFYENCEVSQNISFTEQCCGTASVIAWRYNISNMSVIILVLCCHIDISINISIILVLLY